MNHEIIYAKTAWSLGNANHPFLAGRCGKRNHLAAYPVFHRMAIIIFSNLSIAFDVQEEEVAFLS